MSKPEWRIGYESTGVVFHTHFLKKYQLKYAFSYVFVCWRIWPLTFIWLSTIGEPQELNQIFSFIGALLAHWSSVRKLAQASEGRLQPSNDQHKAGRQVRLRKKVS